MFVFNEEGDKNNQFSGQIIVTHLPKSWDLNPGSPKVGSYGDLPRIMRFFKKTHAVQNKEMEQQAKSTSRKFRSTTEKHITKISTVLHIAGGRLHGFSAYHIQKTHSRCLVDVAEFPCHSNPY